MSSLSPNDDARRTSPRKSARQMPHYFVRESNKQKGVEVAKKSGVGLNKRAAAEESESSSSSNDRHPMMIAIVSLVFSQGRSRGELQLVE